MPLDGTRDARRRRYAICSDEPKAPVSDKTTELYFAGYLTRSAASEPRSRADAQPQLKKPLVFGPTAFSYIKVKLNHTVCLNRPFKTAPRAEFLIILRKEVIQPQVPLRLPCYDLVPIAKFIFGA
jgi:hypothetical protein